jgi:uncharacterized HAD superfamily protein
MNVSFDFDNTIKAKDIPGNLDGLIHKTLNKMWEHRNNNDNIIIVTSRDDNDENKREIVQTLKRITFPDLPIYFTNGTPKVETLKKHNVELHYDDDCEEALYNERQGIKTIIVTNRKNSALARYVMQYETI